MADDRSYPTRPFLGASGLVLHDEHILLVQRGRPPTLGIWSLPGGAVESGEHLSDAIKREIFEETGLLVTPSYVADLVEVLRKDANGACARHFVIAVFFCTLSDAPDRLPQAIAGDDAMDARWVAKDALGDYPLTEGTLDVIQKILAGSRLPN